MLKLVILGLACILLLAFISQHAFAQEWTTYNNGVFAINYPSDWTKVNDNPTTFEPTGPGFVQVTVTIEDSPKATTLDGYTNFDTNWLTSELGASVSAPRQSTLAGFPAVVLYYRDNNNFNGPEAAAEIFAFDNAGTNYKIVYSASPELYDSYFQVANNMMKSFRILATPMSQ